MAEVSMETQAILDRLKAEGQLTRNSGTNSIASVNINLDKLGNLFQVVARNTIEQTSLMRSQLAQQEESAEAQKRRDDLQEITLQKLAGKGGTGTSTVTGTGSGNDGGGEGGGSKFGIMGLLGGMSGIGKKLLFAGVAFAVANVVRGYLDAKFDGAASEAVDSVLGKIGEGLNPENLKAQFASMQTKLGDMTASLERLTTTFDNMILKMDEIMKKIDEFSLSWDTILKSIGNVITGLTLVSIGVNAWRGYQERMSRLNAESEKAAKQRNRFQQQKNDLVRKSLNRMKAGLGLTPALPEAPGSGTSPKAPTSGTPPKVSGSGPKLPTPSASGGAPKISAPPKPPKPPKPPAKPAAPPPTVKTNSGSVSKAEVRADAARTLKGYSLANNGKSLRGPDGKMVSGDAALAELEKTLDPKYSKIFRRVSKFVRLTGWGALLVMMFEVAMILNSDMPDDQKKKALARIFLVGASAALFATAGAIMGSVVPGWGTLIGGLAGGIGGYFAADYVMDSIIEALWSGGNPEQKKIREMEKASKQSEMNYMGSEEGQRSKALAVAEARAGAGGGTRPIQSGGNPMDSAPADIQAILAGSKRNYFTAGDGTRYGNVPGSGQNLRMDQIAPNPQFVESQIKTAVQGASQGMSPAVINNVGGPTYQTIMNSRAGDTNVADIKQFNGSGDGNPMSLAGGG
jgi:hypothetical protein